MRRGSRPVVGKYGMTTLEYLGDVYGRFAGRVTGYQYNFKRRFKIRPVDSRDAECFLEYKDAEGRLLFRNVSKVQGDTAEEGDVHEGASDSGEEDAVGGKADQEGLADADLDVGHEGKVPEGGDDFEQTDT